MDIFTDTDLEKFSIRHLKRSIAECVVADFQGRSTAPPRHAVDFPNGKLVFTTGGYGNLAGFRVYETFRAAPRIATGPTRPFWHGTRTPDVSKARISARDSAHCAPASSEVSRSPY
ncbi:MAG: hypothetical protein P8011_06770 [Acidihalobacter sp.]|uniref:hypothetical protein n=1 Tax=Acidihalobacter sp. TaxID=1872108 RepID=UPI00307CCCED